MPKCELGLRDLIDAQFLEVEVFDEEDEEVTLKSHEIYKALVAGKHITVR